MDKPKVNVTLDNRKLDMNDVVIIFTKPLTKVMVAVLAEDYVNQLPLLLDEGYIECERMTVKQYINFGNC